MNKKKSLNLSERDLQVATWVAEQGPVRQSTINRYLENKGGQLNSRSLRRLTNKLIEGGLINKKQILAGSPIVWPTPSGLRLAGLKLRKGESTSNPSLVTVIHSIQVAEVRVIYERNNAEWICERKLRGTFNDHLPDGVAIHDGIKIIVEIDRTRKEKDRLLQIMLLNLNAYSRTYMVDYWTTPELYDFVSAQKKLLPELLQENIRIFVLPEETK